MERMQAAAQTIARPLAAQAIASALIEELNKSRH
jgi:hypothetical protein